MPKQHKRNFGHGRQMAYAAKMVLKRRAQTSGGRHGWYKSNLIRWNKFCSFCKTQDITDARIVDVDLIYRYRKTLSGVASSVQNDLSAINVVMGLMTDNNWNSFSPSKIAGLKRSNVRSTPVITDPSLVHAVFDKLVAMNEFRLAYIPIFCFHFGLRRREASLLDIRIAIFQAINSECIDITRGTKGGRGRRVDRMIPITQEGLEILESAARVIDGDRCLVPHNKSYKNFSGRISYIVLPILKEFGISRLHDLRAAYACNRYTALSANIPPCNANGWSKRPSNLISEKLTISKELGHSRTDIIKSYIGSER